MADLAPVYRDKSRSTGTKTALALIHFGIVLGTLWLLFGGGLARIEDLFGAPPAPGVPLRRALLAGAAALYFLRTLATVFVFVKRRMPWPEVATIAPWIALLDALFAWFGGRNPAPVGALGGAGAALVLAGSALNTGSEWQRLVWKRRPENRGHLLTGGFFRISRHVNYLGDLVLFTGWVLIAGRPWLLSVPAVMLAGFAFANIPAQDRYLAERYGDEYRAYAERTARLVPFVY